MESKICFAEKTAMSGVCQHAFLLRTRMTPFVSKVSVTLILITIIINVSLAGEITNPKVKWKFKTQGTIRSAPVVDHNGLYVTSADGHLYAIDRQTGKLLWKYKTEGAMSGSATVTPELVIVISRDRHVHAVRKSDGQLRWKFEMKEDLPGYIEWEYFMAAPVVSKNKVFIASGDGNLYALDVASGKRLWRFETNARLRATPLLDGATIYQPSNDGFVYVINSENGAEQWRFETAGASLDQSQGFDRTCIFTKPMLKFNLLVFGSRDGRTYAVDVRTRKKKWEFTYGSTWAMSTAMDNETVFTGWSTNNTFSAVNLRTGAEKWKYICKSVVYSTAHVGETQVIVGSADGHLYSFDKESGEVRWQFNTGSEIHSSPVSDGNGIYFGADNGYIYALEEGGQVHRAVYQPMDNDYQHYPVINGKVAPYLKDRGFQQLDSAGLHQFITARIDDKASSVIVFAYDVIPPNIVGDNPKEGLIRKYLEAGGKILWFGGVPNRFAFDTKGRMHGVPGVKIAEQMLDIKLVTPEESGNYYSQATQDGLNIGLPSWLKTTHASVAPGNVIALAHDEFGRVSAWIKKFNPRSGSGFISCRTWAWDVDIRGEDLELIYTMAMSELN